MAPQPQSLVGPSESPYLHGAFPPFSGPHLPTGLPGAPSHSSTSLLSQAVPVLLRPSPIYRNTNAALSAAASRPEHCTRNLRVGRAPPAPQPPSPPAPQPCSPAPWSLATAPAQAQFCISAPRCGSAVHLLSRNPATNYCPSDHAASVFRTTQQLKSSLSQSASLGHSAAWESCVPSLVSFPYTGRPRHGSSHHRRPRCQRCFRKTGRGAVLVSV